MSRLGVYAYVDGYDLEKVFAQIELQLHQFLIRHNWKTSARLISTHYPRTADLLPDFLPVWNLGVNLDWPDEPEQKKGAEEDLLALAKELAELSEQTGRDFALGIYDEETGISEDFVLIKDGQSSITDFIKMLRELDGE